MAYAKLLTLALIFIGEAVVIYAEMLGARSNHLASEPFLQIFLKMLLVIVVGGGFLIAGYMVGFTAFQNIWIVAAASITSILIIEPIIAWTLFQQFPTLGALAGFILGAIGLVLAIFLRTPIS